MNVDKHEFQIEPGRALAVLALVKEAVATVRAHKQFVLCDSAMEAKARLGALSLLMKGETIPAHSAWKGIPATWQSVSERAGDSHAADPGKLLVSRATGFSNP